MTLKIFEKNEENLQFLQDLSLKFKKKKLKTLNWDNIRIFEKLHTSSKIFVLVKFI